MCTEVCNDNDQLTFVTRKPSLEVAPTTLAHKELAKNALRAAIAKKEHFSPRDREL